MHQRKGRLRAALARSGCRVRRSVSQTPFVGDDALLHNGGADQLYGGEGNDLFLSNSVCDGNLLSGGNGRDNASWARFGEGVAVDLGSGQAGRPGAGGARSCGGGLDSLQEIEDLEGSNFADADPVIDCGDDIDRALIDYPQYGDATARWCAKPRPTASSSCPTSRPRPHHHHRRQRSRSRQRQRRPHPGAAQPAGPAALAGYPESMATWIFEPGHTEAGFRARHMMVTWVRGLFKDVHGRLEFEWDSCLASTFEGEIDATKIWTGQPERDAHLRSADFFDVENHPRISFGGRFTKRTGDIEFKAEADLTIRGITFPVPLDVSYQGMWETPFWVGEENKGTMRRVGFEARTRLNRHDFGVSWQDEIPGGGVVASDEIAIVLDVEAIHLGDLEKTGAIEYYR